MAKLIDLEVATSTADLHRSPRYRTLNALESWVDTTQYAGRPEWFDGSEGAPPLRSRKPCIAYPIVRAAIDSNVDLCLGEGKFPAIQLTDGDDQDVGGAPLSDNDRSVLDLAISKLVKQARIKPAIRQAFALAQAAGSSVVIGGVRKGKPFLDVEQSKRCSPTFNVDGDIVELEIEYPYVAEIRQYDGSWRAECRIYRRVIDTQRDVTYVPVVAPKDGRGAKVWIEQSVIEHKLGFCPVVWYRHMLACSTVGSIDGRAIHQYLTDEIEALDMALSQWHRAVWFAGDPQMIATGVGSGVALTGESFVATPASLLHGDGGPIFSSANGGALSDDNPINGQWAPRPKPALIKGPGELWEFENDKAKVDLLTLDAGSLKAISDHCADLRNKVSEGLAVVFTDPDMTRFANSMSGKAQQMLRARQLDRCDQYRDDMCDGLIVPVVHMLLNIIAQVGVRSAVITAAVKLLPKLGEEPGISLRWGAYYAPDPDEEDSTAKFLKTVDSILPLPLKTKIQKLARALHIDNVDAFVRDVEAEIARRDSKTDNEAEKVALALLGRAHGKAAGSNRESSDDDEGEPPSQRGSTNTAVKQAGKNIQKPR